MKKILLMLPMVLMAFVLSLTGATNVEACSPTDDWTSDPEVRYQSSDVVFVGTVIAVSQEMDEASDYMIRFHVDKYYKGEKRNEVNITTASSSATCGYDSLDSFDIGSVWSIYASDNFSTSNLQPNTKYTSVSSAISAMNEIAGAPTEICSRNYDPVCGENDKEYLNMCFLDMANVELRHTGTCINVYPNELELRVSDESINSGDDIGFKWNRVEADYFTVRFNCSDFLTTNDGGGIDLCTASPRKFSIDDDLRMDDIEFNNSDSSRSHSVTIFVDSYKNGYFSGDDSKTVVVGPKEDSYGGEFFTRDLTIGSTGSDVVRLQEFLIEEGHLVLPYYANTGYFGLITNQALASYQVSRGISPATGHFELITRALINSEIDGSSTSCPTNYEPVCGGNGVTYSNLCLLDMADTSLEHPGACINIYPVEHEEYAKKLGLEVSSKKIESGEHVTVKWNRVDADSFTMTLKCSSRISNAEFDNWGGKNLCGREIKVGVDDNLEVDNLELYNKSNRNGEVKITLKAYKNGKKIKEGSKVVVVQPRESDEPTDTEGDLTIGSSGHLVVELQSFLIREKFLQMPAGLSLGYFGEVTRVALADYQNSRNIRPATGFYGPITRASVERDMESWTEPEEISKKLGLKVYSKKIESGDFLRSSWNNIDADKYEVSFKCGKGIALKHTEAVYNPCEESITIDETEYWLNAYNSTNNTRNVKVYVKAYRDGKVIRKGNKTVKVEKFTDGHDNSFGYSSETVVEGPTSIPSYTYTPVNTPSYTYTPVNTPSYTYEPEVSLPNNDTPKEQNDNSAQIEAIMELLNVLMAQLRILQANN